MTRISIHSLRFALIGLTTALFTACAAEGGPDGGADNLPDRGITGWVRSATDNAKPYVLTVDDALLGGPSALVVADKVVVYGHRAFADGSFDLFRAEGDATGATFSTPVALGIAGRDPSVSIVAGVYWLAYLATDSDTIVIATSPDGTTFTPLTTSGIAADRAAPSLIVEDARVRLYLSTGTTLVETEAVRSEALSFGPEVEVLAPQTGCIDASDKPKECWDQGAVVDGEVRRAHSPDGSVVYRLFYRGKVGGDTDIGFAASYDGVTFARFPYNPVLTGSPDERSPTSIIADDTYVLFWDEARATNSGGLLRASHIPTAPSDRW